MDAIMNLCEVCIQKNYKFYKRIPSKQLIFNRPKDRYVIDLTYIPIDLMKNKNNIYLLNIIDHFSKYLISYLIYNKKGQTISKKLAECFKKFGNPKEIGADDNGSEFSNKYVKNLLNNNNIKLVNGKPYNPHSQGTVERVHQTIKTMLICKFLENKKYFDILSSLNYVVSVYNDTKHRSTLYKPNEVFFIDDPKLFEKVKFKILNTSKNYIATENLFKINDSVLIFNNFNSHFIKNKECYYLEKSKLKK